ncbi:dystrotelin [Sardina pilchardus]|uniref:dystrotelin n=1 Tax=Sardina pilchardus TaxID=27697 RepID=UPI002E0EFB62
MDLDSIEGLNEVRPAVYRAALKLRSLQKLCQMHTVTLTELRPVLLLLSQSADPQRRLSEAEVRQGLEKLFQSVPEEIPGQVVPEAIDQTTRLLFKLYDRPQAGSVLLHSVQAALTALSGDTLTAKHRALYRLGESLSGQLGSESSTVTRSGLRVLLHDLSQLPCVVQESHVFSHVETAVRSCFSGVMTAGVCEEVFVSWLQSEPRLLLWLSTLYRISASEAVVHAVRCRACKAFPITGLRYRCLKCVNLHLCQTCFLTERRSKKHKPSHPVLEYCSQPTWRESVASLALNARHALLPRRHTRREAERRRELTRGESSGDPTNSPHSDSPPVEQQPSTLSQQSCDFCEMATPPPRPPTVCPQVQVQVQVESKALQTEEDLQPQRKTSFLQKDLHMTQKVMKDLQRDKWLLEKEFQVWRTAAQSEHDSLEDRCAELEATMETLSQHNQSLEHQLRHVRHALSLRMVNTGHVPHPVHTPPSTDCSEGTAGPQGSPSESPTSQRLPSEEGEDMTQEEEVVTERNQEVVTERNQEVEEDESRECSKEEGGSELSLRSDSTGCDDDTWPPDVTSDLQQCVEKAEELLWGEEGSGRGEAFEEKTHSQYQEETLGGRSQEDYQGSALEEEEEEDEGEEEQLCELVLRLKTTLSLPTHKAGSQRRDVLLVAAQGVGDSVSNLVSMVNFYPGNPPQPLKYQTIDVLLVAVQGVEDSVSNIVSSAEASALV